MERLRRLLFCILNAKVVVQKMPINKKAGPIRGSA